jgi:hypothetical protein
MSDIAPFYAAARFTNQDGTLTPSAARMWQLVLQRIGGARGDMGDDVFALFISDAYSEQVIEQAAPDAQVCEIVRQPLQTEAFPVGFVMITTVAANPSTYLGYGKWTATSQGMVPAGYLAGDPDFGTPGGTSGAKTKAISAHAGTAVADHVHHTHDVTSNVTTTSATVQSGTGATVVGSGTNNTVTSGNENPTLTHNVTQPSDHTALNVIQPSMTFYIFERTA